MSAIKCALLKILLTTELHIASFPYRSPPKDDAGNKKKQLDALLKTEIIKPSHISYSVPITLAFKKEDNTYIRLCVDYRKLNDITKLDTELNP
ncbi:hypothetical protein NPIL_496711 [Nephila pilipes]|uniref:Reverse transcriptase n=1 Tax=Nephila pilipes TaxID=299642 RepID=A0A8X6Q0L6_NEPPI|nr:hypothetical protein NPIL_496711 [Nephila pilipes]